ncbi:MAG: hypothetical protein H8E36_05465 [Rhodospirillaceae bacterium]|nr:hypothetical protein [Rhodospirillaceae bacterium]
MAQIPRTLPSAVPTNVTAGRLQGGPRSVASADSAQIEATNAQDGVLFNDALLFQDRETTDRRGGDNSQGNHRVEYAGSSQTFASIFEDTAASSGSVQKARSKGFANLIARAITTYETNVQVIHGTTDPRGTTLSLTL